MTSIQMSDSARRVEDSALVRLMVLRVVVVTALMGAALVADVIRPGGPGSPFYVLVALTYLLTILYALAWPFTVNRRRELAYVQIVGDLLTITAIVYFTGASSSDFSLLYFISIIAASIILFRWGGMVAASAATVLYGGLNTLAFVGVVPLYPPSDGVAPAVMPAQVVAYTVFLNVFGFYTVAFLSSYLSESLRLTGRKLAEASDFLADLQVFNQTIVDSITSGLMTTDFDGKINFFNASAASIFGRAPAAAVGTNVIDLLSESVDFMDRIKEKLGDGRRFVRLEGTYRDGNGDEIYLGMSISYLLYGGETKSGLLFTFQDLTEIKRLEREVRLKENLATMGEMAAGMAHEIRNPLASISGSVQVLREERSFDDEQVRLMDIIVRESERLSATLSDFLTYARPQRFEPRRIDLRDTLSETATLLGHSSEVLPEHEIILDTPDEPVFVHADPNQMKQITWNLSRNALQAMPSGGRLVMSVMEESDGNVVMSFRDEGIGMSEDEVGRAFAPFSGGFERGSGLGLAIVYRLVKDYDGDIQVDSVAPRGTEVSVHFPLERRVAD